MAGYPRFSLRLKTLAKSRTKADPFGDDNKKGNDKGRNKAKAATKRILRFTKDDNFHKALKLLEGAGGEVALLGADVVAGVGGLEVDCAEGAVHL
jgi:hypothetical protein